MHGLIASDDIPTTRVSEAESPIKTAHKAIDAWIKQIKDLEHSIPNAERISTPVVKEACAEMREAAIISAERAGFKTAGFVDNYNAMLWKPRNIGANEKDAANALQRKFNRFCSEKGFEIG